MEALGRRALSNGDFETALWFFQQILVLHPDHEEATQMLQSLSLKLGKGASASLWPFPLLHTSTRQDKAMGM